MCEVCADFLQLLESYETRITSNDAKHSILLKSEIEIAFGYIQAWPQRQCMCLYRDIKNFERFNLIVQSMVCLTVHHLKHMESLLDEYKNLASSHVQTQLPTQSPASSPVPITADKEVNAGKSSSSSTTGTEENFAKKNIKNDKKEESNNEISNAAKDNATDTANMSIDSDKISTDNEQRDDNNKSPTSPPPPPPRIKPDNQAVVTSCQIIKPCSSSQYGEEHWILDEVDKLFLLVSKIFLLNFPLYIAFKHSTQARLDDISAEEAQHLSIFCDLHDNDIPVYLLRNVSLFCNSGGFTHMMSCFQQFDMPVSTAHAITSVVSNVKLWLNYSCIVQLFMPLRSRVLQYMCKLSDIKLRSAPIRNMADFVWSAVREPMDNSLTFDVEGLALAFKYFTSTTLTMRLAGMAQINAHVNLFNEICTSETVGEVEVMGTKMANWLTEHQIIQHLFGPNLHVEVIKQAPVVLTFLAVENKITDEHIKLIWQATQLKHCSKTVFDILPSLVKNLTPRPAMHLYSLLCRLEPKDHTEQSIYIASALTKLIWSRDHSRPQMGLALHEQHMIGMHTSSESGSMDGSQSDDEAGNGDDSSLASGRKSPIDIEAMGSDTGVTPCKQARRRRHICDPTNEKPKQLNDEELNLLHPKVDMKLQNHRIVNILEHSSSEDDLQATALEMQMHRKKSRKRRKNNNSNNQLPQLAHEMVEAIWDGGEEDASSDELDDDEEHVLQDSDECSDSISQVLPSDVIKHLHGEGPFIRAIAETHISELLSGPENDGSYSSPLSNKSEKNLADFDDEDVSPCEEELAQLVGTIGRVAHNSIPPAFAQAAAAMAVAHNAMSMTKTDANVAAAAAAVTAAAAATVTAQQSLEAMRQQASAVAKGAIAAATAATGQSKTSTCESDIDAGEMSKDSPRASISSTCSGNSQQQLTFKLNDVCLPGNTLLWDLLQDDKITQLGEALALEAENALATLLCFSVDRLLRTKFIEGCMQNLANNRSVVVSLRLLPKIFASFQQFRPTDTHQVTLWAERQHRMMYHFFNNIKYYAKQHAELLSKSAEQLLTEQPFYTHKTQVSVRLHFLSSIFSSLGSPKNFRLSLDQVDALWEWLAHDPECSDCYFSWLQNQAKGGNQHALGLEALQHIYLKKLPELRPEDFSMVALGLFQQLCSLARIALSQYEKHKDLLSTSSNVVGMFHLWKIALRAHNTEVSLAAIQYINMYYMGQQLRLEKEFVSQCMDNLVQATNALESNEDENALMCVQRGLMLLNTHLETFRRRYAFHLRRWAIEGKGVASHSNLKNEANGPTLRIIVQPHGLSDKTVLQMHACDLIAELKAEISKWWENYQSNSNSGVTAPVLGLLLSEGPLRIITQGQELTPEYDERSLGDAGFKDNQIVQISQGVPGTRRNLDHPSMQPPPPKECLPTVLLLQPKYFEKLFCLMQTLGDMKPQNNNLQLYTKAQLLSRRVWDILAILPTNPLILDAFKNLTSDLASCEQHVLPEEQANKRKEIKQLLIDLLDPSNLQKFMYSLHIVESLTMNCVHQQHKIAATTSYINGGDSGLITEQQQHLQHARTARSGAARKTINRRRSSNENSIMKEKIHERGESVKRSHATVITEISGHKDSSDSSSTHKEQGGGSTNESEQSEAGSSSNDKENNPLKQNKRHKKATDVNMEGDQLLDQTEKERIMGMQKFQSVVNSSGPESPTVRVTETKWSDAFIKCGGLKILYDIFITGQLQCSAHPKELLNEWRHDCLASLLRILWMLGFEDFQSAELHVNISKPRSFMLDLMEVDGCLRRLSSILNDEAYQNYQMPSGVPYQFHQYHNVRTGFWGRASVVQFAINMTVSFVHAAPEARRLIWTQTEYCNWVQKFILDDPDPSVRREVCAGLYRICLGNPQNYQLLLAPLLRKLISFLPAAEKMTSHTPHTQFLLSEEGKEPYGPACRDYFWLLSRLVDTLSPELNKNPLESAGDNEQQTIDIERLCDSVSQSILSRDFYETRHGNQDDALVGLINLMSNLVKYDPTFKFSPCAAHFIDKLLEFLFDMPSPSNRQKPKCKSATSRAACYDLLVELCRNCPENYAFLHEKLIAQHTPTGKQTYPWDYWPRDEGRSECGYVGLTNLGATCYMASCVQHLYMMPQARTAIIQVPPNIAQKHGPTLVELQRMFAYLLESERKAYNPRSFCRVYQMDHQPLNTGEQKDMAEFFIDLVSKLEEMTPDLKDLVKTLFCGTLSNNVVSLDCEHVSRTAEEFYTVRCQVADMRNLQESLDEVTVKDTLEGDNMYTCSQCGKKVRAEKRACFKKLPQILCFNTMRYTFNMVTMLKEKVNTHFSFPMRLNMIDYVEKTLMPHQYKEDREKRKKELLEKMKDVGEGEMDKDSDNKIKHDAFEDDDDLEECLEYELVGVTVHTGTADGGHYYSFIKERNEGLTQHDRWFLFNDAEVKPFDPSQIGAECFGGEMTSKTYDSVTEKYLDFSFEKTNSAYMLFYERRLPEHLKQRHSELLVSPATSLKIEELSKLSNKRRNPAEDEGNDGDNTSTSSSEAIKTLTAMLLHDSDAESCDEDMLKTKTGKNYNKKLKKSIVQIKKKISIDVDDVNDNDDNVNDDDGDEPQASTSAAAALKQQLRLRPRLNKELEDWIWQDNRQFLQDRNIFEHTYFNFMWQICGHIPQTLVAQADVSCMAAKLSVSFFLETFIHAKEKQPTMVPWVELLTKQFSASQEACEWFLGHMSQEPWWPVQVLVQCPNQVVRQMFQRLILHVINKLRPTHVHLYLKNEGDNESKTLLGSGSSVTRFMSALVLLMEHGARPHVRHLTEYFSLLQEFARLGEEETMFMLRIGVIKSVADFYLGHKTHETVDVGSDNEDNSSDEALAVDKTRPAALEKMIALVTNLVERSRGPDFRLRLSAKDFAAIAGGKGLPFLYQQIKDNINAHQTKNLIHALCRWDERLANHIVSMLITSVTKHTDLCAPFFKLLTLLADTQGAPAGLPCFSQLILQRVWDAAEYCPQAALEWLSFQAPKNKIAHAWILQTAENWVEQFLLAHNNARVRNAAAYLLISLVPSQQYRASFRAHALHKLTALTHHTYRELSSDAESIVHTLMNLLLRLLRTARVYADIGMHGTNKLTAYFGLLSYLMVSKTEKLLVGPFMRNLWDLFHPRLSEPSVPAHHNKHALLAFWHHSLADCPENALTVANNPEITRNIAFNYILADHEDTEIVSYNRAMLPMYYGMLRMCCEQSRNLTRQLSGHQNLQWAFKNITPHPTQYTQAVEELFKLMRLFAIRHHDAGEQEQLEVTTFRRTTLSSYLASLDARVSWSTLINALQILVDNEDDRLLVIYNGGIEMCFDALHTLHSMHHEATACHVVGDLQELLHELILLLGTLRSTARQDSATSRKHVEKQAHLLQQQHEQLLQKQHEQLKLQHSTQSQTEQQQQQQQQLQTTSQQKEKQMAQMQQHLQLQQMQQHLQQHHYLRQQHQATCLLKGLPEALKRLATLLNTYNPPELTRLVLDVLKELVRNTNLDAITILTPILLNSHLTASTAPNSIGPLGVYFPRRNKSPWPISKLSRPPRPMLQMSMPHGEVFSRGSDAEHDALVEAFYKPYHDFVDVMLRMAVNKDALNESLVKLSCLLGIEASGLHFNLFPKFWVGIYNNKSTNKYAELLINNPMLIEYIHLVLRDERKSLGDQYIRNFLEIYYPKISHNLPVPRLIYTITYAMHAKEDIDDLCGDLFAIRVIAQATGVPSTARKQLRGSLKALMHKSARYLEEAKNGIIANKKQKLEEDLIKTSAKKKDKESSNNSPTQRYAAELMEIMRVNNNKATKPDTTSMEEDEDEKPTTISDTTSPSTTDINKMKDDKMIQIKSREGTPSTASEDETEVSESDKRLANVKMSAVDQSDDDDDDDDEDDENDNDDDDDEDDEGGLITACGPVFASNTLNSNNKNLPSTSSSSSSGAKIKGKSIKNAGCESVSSDDNSIYTIHKSSTTSSGSGERLTVTLAKNSNKKTATDRQLAEHEKRCKMLHTMESYIRSILALMQKDEEPTSLSSSSIAITNTHKPMDTDLGGSGVVLVVPRKTNTQQLGTLGDSSSSEDENIARKLNIPKSPTTTPPPLVPLSNSHISAIVKAVSTATTATVVQAAIPSAVIISNNNIKIIGDEEVEAMSIGHEDDDEIEDRSMTEVTALANGDDIDVDIDNDDDEDGLTTRSNVSSRIITNVQAETANSSTTTMETVDSLEESDIITSSPASPVSEMLTSTALEPSQL